MNNNLEPSPDRDILAANSEQSACKPDWHSDMARSLNSAVGVTLIECRVRPILVACGQFQHAFCALTHLGAVRQLFRKRQFSPEANRFHPSSQFLLIINAAVHEPGMNSFMYDCRGDYCRA